MNRSDLMDQYWVSVYQECADLNRYIGFAPDNMLYDKSARTYVRGSEFRPQFLEPGASRYLAQLRSVTDGILDREDAWIANLPPYAAAPTPVRGVNPATLRADVGAIRRSEAIEVKYQSLSSPEPRWRWIAPHAIAFDGFRWHTRAFCHADGCFKDFLLSRVLEIRGSGESDKSADDDLDWLSEVTLEVEPHPELSETQAKVIALDYGMRGGKAKIKVKRAPLLCAQTPRSRYRPRSAHTPGPADRAYQSRRDFQRHSSSWRSGGFEMKPSSNIASSCQKPKSSFEESEIG